MSVLFNVVLLGAPLLFVAALLMRRKVARGSRFPRAQRVIASLAVAAAIAPGIWLLVTASYTDGQTLVAVNGAGVLILILIPIGLAVPSLATSGSSRTMRTAIGALAMAIFCFVTGFSIGPLYAPAAALLILAGATGLITPPVADRASPAPPG